MSDPTCRSCYANTLTKDERDRFNSEPVTGCIYLCAVHQQALDDLRVDLAPMVRMVKFKGFPRAVE